jgi:DNA-binding transcriptional LysR family regulator
MELRHLRYFVAAAEMENVSQAALKLHVSQPGVSRQIHDLEDEIGFQLFERSAKSLKLTRAGKTFLDESRAVLQRAEEAVKAARAVAGGVEGEIHVGYAPSPTARILPLALRDFQARFPHVRVRLHDLSTEEMLTALRGEKLHVALMVRPTRAMLTMIKGLQFEELARDAICLAVPPDHHLARRRTVTLAQAARESLIALSRNDYPEAHECLTAAFSDVGLKPRIVEEHDSITSIIAAVESGAGVALAAQSLACLAGPRLRLLPLTPAPAPLVIGAAFRKEGLPAAARDFIAAARSVAAGA